jgi:hypothetical protein
VGAATTFPSPFEAAGAGPTIGPSTISWNPAAQLEAHRHGGPWFVGAAVDLGPRHIHPFGVALVVGRHVRAGRVGAEASVGVGEQAFIDRTYWFDVGPPGYTEETRAAAYARVSCAATYQLTTLLDLLAQVGGHLTATTRSEAGFALASLGLRVKLP